MSKMTEATAPNLYHHLDSFLHELNLKECHLRDSPVGAYPLTQEQADRGDGAEPVRVPGRWGGRTEGGGHGCGRCQGLSERNSLRTRQSAGAREPAKRCLYL